MNISYSQSESDYDKAFCSMSMTDFRENLILATESEPNAIPGVTIMGIKSGEGQTLYQKFLPFAFIIQAALCCIPMLLWKTWASELLRASVRFIAELSEKVPQTIEFSRRDNKTEQSYEILPQDLSHQIDFWGSRKFLTSFYTTKLMLNLGIFIFIITFYMAYPTLGYFSLQEFIVCHVHKQSLVTCAFPDIDLFKMAWIINITLIDVSIIIVVLQLINLVFCMPRKKSFFSWYLRLEERNSSRMTNDAHLISYFCHENLCVMSFRVIYNSHSQRKFSYTPLISLGSSEEDLNTSTSSSSLSYTTAPQIFRRQTITDGEQK